MGDIADHDPLLIFWEGRWKEGHTPWDHGQPAPPFAEFIHQCGVPAGKVAMPGPGSGHDVRFFAELGANVTGIDIAPTSIEVAHRLNAHPLAKYRVGNILDPDPRWHGQFDWVIEHTCLCAIERPYWPEYVQGVRKLLKPQGYYLALFYRDPIYDEEDGPPFGIDEATIEELFSPWFTLIKAWVPKRSHASRQDREELRWFRLKD